MPDEAQEFEQPEKSVEIGEWFKPFERYEDQPYDYLREDYRAKGVDFVVDQIGKFNAGLSSVEDAEYNDGDGIVILPFKDDHINISNHREASEKYESRLMSISVISSEKKHLDQDLPYAVEIRTPTNNIYQSPFETNDMPGWQPPFTFDWYDQQGNEITVLLVPEVENVLSRIEIRVVPKE